MRNLQHLILYNNAIQVLPETFCSLSQLSMLDLRMNELRKFPLCLCKLKSLQQLFLSGNYMEELPQDIKFMKRLLVLRIGKNLLKSLPQEICTLTNLSTLSLQNNHIEELPIEIYKLKGLLPVSTQSELRLLLDGNPLKKPPPEIVAKGTQAVFSYLESEKVQVKPKPLPIERTPMIGTNKKPETNFKPGRSVKESKGKYDNLSDYRSGRPTTNTTGNGLIYYVGCLIAKTVYNC